MTGLVVLAGDPHELCRWNPGDDPDMPAEMRWRVASAQPCAVVQLVGILDTADTEPVRAALLTFLADQPATVLVDLTELSAPNPASLGVFAAAAREASRWPAARLMIISPPDQPRTGYRGYEPVAVRGGMAETVARLAATRREPEPQLDLDPVVGAARQARAYTLDRCARWDVAGLAESACIAVTELVNNVVAHAHTPMSLRLRLRDDALQLAVRDHSTGRPSFTGPASPTSTGGRGLLLIDMIAREWGASTLVDGKVVWALLRPEDESPP